jgi:hypothetical protein
MKIKGDLVRRNINFQVKNYKIIKLKPIRRQLIFKLEQSKPAGKSVKLYDEKFKSFISYKLLNIV